MSKIASSILILASFFLLFIAPTYGQGVDPVIPHTDGVDTGNAKLIIYDHWLCRGNYLVIWSDGDFTGQAIGDQADLAKYGWNRRTRSIKLIAQPETAVWLYYDPNFSMSNGVLELKMPQGFNNICINRMTDPVHSAATWVSKGRPLTKNCGSVKWK